jgi:Fur family ferric uptake transcriptional regulator
MERLKSILHNEGLRYTNQRQEIWNELLSSTEHRDAEEIYYTLINRGIKVSRATVYRTIDVLVKNGLIDKLEIGDGKARFEYNDKYKHHDHLICTSCGKIVEFHDPDIEKCQRKIARNHKFELLHHSHQLFGICEDCK